MLKRLRTWSRRLKGEVVAVAIAMKDPKTPWYAKVLGAGIVAYALSPIDLIPDFIPLLGMVDDAILIPLGIKLLVALIPPEVMEQSRGKAAELEGVRRSLAGAVLVVVAWIVLLSVTILLYRRKA